MIGISLSLPGVSALNKGGGVPANALVLRDGSPLTLRNGTLYLLRSA